MVNMKKRFLFTFLFGSLFFQTIHCHDQIVQISIIKSGTFLLATCINLLNRRSLKDWLGKPISKSQHYNITGNELIKMTSMKPQNFWSTHLFYTQERAEYLNKKNFIKLFMYRDPRDQMVSFAYFMKRFDYGDGWPRARGLSFDEILMDMINSGYVYDDHPPVKSIYDMYQKYLPWKDTPGFLTVRFEDLVGEKGGGSKEAQIETIRRVAQHLKIPLTDKLLEHVMANIFGNLLVSPTFREGQIGSWKKHFKPEHIKAFKKKTGDLLITLGYEKDNNW